MRLRHLGWVVLSSGLLIHCGAGEISLSDIGLTNPQGGETVDSSISSNSADVSNSSNSNNSSGPNSDGPSSSSPNPSSTGSPTPTPTPTPPPATEITPVPDSDCTIFVNKNDATCTANNSSRANNSVENPYCNINGANDNHIPGDVVCIMPGEYRERLVPKAGNSNADRTVYKGLGNRSEVVVLGSDQITGWQQYSGSIYRAPFEANRQYRANSTYVYNTNCWIDRKTGNHRWLLRAALTGTGDTLADLDAPGEFFYDQNSNPRYLYVRMPDNSNPGNRVECSKRPVFNMGERSAGNVLLIDPYSPTYGIQNFILENLTIMHTHNRGISIRDARMSATSNESLSENITINNIEIAYTTGGSYVADNPAAIIHTTDGYCNGCVNNFNITNSVIRDVGCDHGPIEDPRIEGSTHRGAAIETYGLGNSLIQGNVIYNAPESIFTKNGNVNITLRNNVIHDVKEGLGVGTITAGPNYFAGTIEGNILYNISGWAINSRWGNTHLIIRNNTIHNALGGIAVDSDRTDDRHGNVQATISNNLVSDVVSAPGLLSNYFLLFLYNSAASSTSDYNLFYDPGALDGFAVTSCDGSYPGATGTCATVYSNLNAWDNTGKDTHSVVANPMFMSTNPANANFLRPASTSPACSAGQSGTHVGALPCL